MYKSVLLTVDINEPASWTRALPQAVELVRASGGKLHVLTVVPDYGSAMVASYFPPDFETRQLQTAKDNLDALVATEVPKGVKVEAHIAHGALHDHVLEAVASTKADLVVMASHAPDRVREFLVGSQADRVVRRSPVSVLVVRG